MPDDQRILTGEVLPPLDKVQTSIGAASFGDGLRVKHSHDVGSTVFQLLEEHLPAPFDTKSMVVELVRGHARMVVPHDKWHHVRPKGGTQLVVSIVPKGNPKKILRSVLLITVAIAAFYTGGLTAGALLPGAATNSLGFLFVQGLTAAAITAVGSLAINALLPVKPPTSQVDEARTSAGSLSNRLTPGAPVPVVLGDMRVYPPFAAAPYTENVGEDRYQVALLTVGHGPVKISDIRIGTIPIEEYEDVTIDVREGWSTDPAIGIYQNEVTTDQHGVLLESGVWQEFTTRANTDEAHIDFVFERGLALIDKKGKRQHRTVDIDVQYRAVGSSTWLTLNTYQNIGTGNVRIPFVNFGGFSNPALGVFEGGTAVATQGGFQFRGKKTVPRVFTEEMHFPERGQYEVRFRRTTATAPDDGDETILDEVKLAIIRSVKHEPPLRGQAVQKGLGLIAIKLRLTDQKAGAIQDLNCRVQRYYPLWDGTNWIDPETVYSAAGDLTPHLSRNPAAAFCYAIRGSAGKRTMPDNRLHMETIAPWWSACDETDPRTGESRFTYDRVIEQPTTLKALLQEIAHVGRARLDGPDGRTGVVRDMLQTDPKGVFTPRNMRGFKGSFSLGEEIHAARVTFANEDNHYQEDTITVYADGWNEETASSFLDLTHPGCTRTAQAHVYGRDQLLALKYRPEPMEFDAPVDAIHNRIGDYVVVHTNMAVPVQIGGAVQEGAAARITEIYEDASEHITSVKLDSVVPVKAGVDYSLIIRRGRKTGLTVTAEIQGFGANTETDTFTFTAPLTDTQSIDEGCLVVLGETNRVARDCIISAIRPSGNMEFKVKVLDLAPEIHNSQTESLPVFPVPAGFSQDPVPERVDNLTLTESLVYDGGLGRLVVTARWEPNNTAVATSRVEIYEVDGANYIKLGETTDNKFELPGTFTAGETVEIAVVAVSPSGAKRPIYLARRASLLLTLEADTAVDISDIIGDQPGLIVQNGYFNKGTRFLEFTAGWERIVWTNTQGLEVNAMRHRPNDDVDSWANAQSGIHEIGPRLVFAYFNTRPGEIIPIRVFGDTENSANGQLHLGIAWYDEDGIFMDEIEDDDTITAAEVFGDYGRSFTTPQDARFGRVYVRLEQHSAGDWIIGSVVPYYGTSRDQSARDMVDGPADPGATDGATLGVNVRDEDGLIIQGDEIRTADGLLTFARFWDFKWDAKGWGTNNMGVTGVAQGILYEATNDNAHMISPGGLNLDGSLYDKVAVRIKRGAAVHYDFFEQPLILYKTAAHDFVASQYRKGKAVRLGDQTARTIVFDMSDLTVGGDDWVTSIIDQIRFDPSTNEGDVFEIDWIGIGRVSAPALDAVNHNLADELTFEDFAATDTSDVEVFGAVNIADVGLKVGQIVSASCEIIATGARRGQLQIIFEQSDNTDIATYTSQFSAANVPEYQDAPVEGYTIPSGCAKIRFLLLRESGPSGAVGARRLTLNRGSSYIDFYPIRTDVEQNATFGAPTGSKVGNTEAGVVEGQALIAQQLTEDNGTAIDPSSAPFLGAVAFLDTVTRSEVADGAAGHRTGGKMLFDETISGSQSWVLSATFQNDKTEGKPVTLIFNPVIESAVSNNELLDIEVQRVKVSDGLIETIGTKQIAIPTVPRIHPLSVAWEPTLADAQDTAALQLKFSLADSSGTLDFDATEFVLFEGTR